VLPSRPSRAFDYSGLHRIANARRVRIPIQQAQRLQGQALHRTPQDNMSNHFKFGGINSKFLERINFADERVHKKDQHARQSKTSDGKSKPTAEFSRDLVSCVKKLDSLPSNLTDTKEQRPSMRDHQSHTASFRRRNKKKGSLLIVRQGCGIRTMEHNTHMRTQSLSAAGPRLTMIHFPAAKATEVRSAKSRSRYSKMTTPNHSAGKRRPRVMEIHSARETERFSVIHG
jgi:hypothetical protein